MEHDFEQETKSMTLSNAIAIIRRQDAKVRVEVPAAQGRKAYSYMREGSDNPSTPKSGVSKKMIGGAIAGVVGVGALTAGVLAMRKGGSPESNATKSKESNSKPNRTKKAEESEDNELKALKKIRSSAQEALKKVREARSKIQSPSVPEPEPKSVSEPESKNVAIQRRNIELNKGEIDLNKAVNIAGKKTKRLLENLEIGPDTPSKKGNWISRTVESTKKRIEKGIERDREAGGLFAERRIDLNKAASNAGKKSRIAVDNIATFAKASAEVFGKKQPNSVDVKATEVNETLPEGRPMKKAITPKEPKPKKAKAPKAPKLKPPTAAEKRAIQQQLNDLNK